MRVGKESIRYRIGFAGRMLKTTAYGVLQASNIRGQRSESSSPLRSRQAQSFSMSKASVPKRPRLMSFAKQTGAQNRANLSQAHSAKLWRELSCATISRPRATVNRPRRTASFPLWRQFLFQFGPKGLFRCECQSANHVVVKASPHNFGRLAAFQPPPSVSMRTTLASMRRRKMSTSFRSLLRNRLRYV